MFTTRIAGFSRALAAGAGALILLTACGGADHTAATGPAASGAAPAGPAATAGGAQSGAFNDADVTFAQMMIPHHEQAVEMAELAETRASDAEVKELAAKIKGAQDPEIKTMTGWLAAWGKAAPSSGSGGHDAVHGMPGIMSEKDMSRLREAKGAEFDRLFAQLMIVHHEGAIEMARTEQAEGTDLQAKELAKTIETAQQAEVEQMRKLLDRL